MSYQSHHLSGKVISCLLSAALIFTALAPSSALAASSHLLVDSKSVAAEAYNKKEVKRVKEVVEKRDRFSRQFLNNDGSYTSEVSMNPVHYKDQNGKWQDISNRIVSSKGNKKEAGYEYTNEANEFQTHFANNTAADTLANIELNDTLSLAWGLKERNKVNSVIDNESITYPEVLPSTDLEYKVFPDGLKEDIILKDSKAPNTFSFTLSTNGLQPVLQEDGSIIMKDSKSNKEQLALPPAYMVDKNNVISDKVKVTLTPTKDPNQYDLTLTADLIVAAGSCPGFSHYH